MKKLLYIDLFCGAGPEGTEEEPIDIFENE